MIRHRFPRFLSHIVAAMMLAPAAPLAAQPADAPNPAIWANDADGAIRHKLSGVAFPPAYGIFKRSRVVTIAPDGSDVAIGYDAQDGASHIRLSLYLFRPRGDERGVKGALTALAAHSPQAFVWADGPFLIPAPRQSPVPLRAYKGVYKTGEGPRAVLDYLYQAELGAWSVKVRATIAPANDPSQEEAIDLVVRDLPWAAILKANGPCTGLACRTTGAAPFDSHMAEALLPNLLLRTIKFDPAAERVLPVVGKAATPPLGDVAIRRATKEPLVYVAEVAGLGTFRLIKLPDVLRRLVDGAFGKLSIEGPVYAAVIDSAGSLLMPRFFAGGEPTPAQFGAVVSELVLHSTASPFVTVKETAAAIPSGE